MSIQLEPTKSIKGIKPSYIREILAATTKKGMISLAGGLPDESFFPMQIIEQAMDEIKSDSSLFQYGSTQGHPALLKYIQDTYVPNKDEDALICTGSQQALDLIARAFINPNDQIVMEAPSYLGALQVFELAQAKIHCVEPNNDFTGPNIEALEVIFKNNDIKFFYAVPDFHNPTGICWSLQTRKNVALLCEKYQVYFIEDAPYRELRFTGEELPLVSSLYKNTITLRSFSKIATPGIRLGALIAKKDLINTMITIKQTSDLHSSVPMQALLLKLLTHENFESHFDKMRRHYQNKHDIMIKSINKQLNGLAQASAVAGGMFVWLKTDLIASENIETFARMLLTKNVAVVPSNVFYPQDFSIEKQQPGLRLNFTHATADNIEIAIKVLKEEMTKLSKV
ncbi:MAG: PLP-dependent aminotransferase family protein [Saccharospirillaceae bacterium]|nr:PLP-dependent aminotransferase family protein [Pseudomonadales bacterium]NRB78777.1 PLP-dependent aminotransferase family protein [Saccharospirillaceae bacterium]